MIIETKYNIWDKLYPIKWVADYTFINCELCTWKWSVCIKEQMYACPKCHWNKWVNQYNKKIFTVALSNVFFVSWIVLNEQWLIKYLWY